MFKKYDDYINNIEFVDYSIFYVNTAQQGISSNKEKPTLFAKIPGTQKKIA